MAVFRRHKNNDKEEFSIKGNTLPGDTNNNIAAEKAKSKK